MILSLHRHCFARLENHVWLLYWTILWAFGTWSHAVCQMDTDVSEHNLLPRLQHLRPCTSGWPYIEDTWLFCDYYIWVYLVLCLSCAVVVLSCTVVVLTCFVMCVCVCVCVVFVMCGCFDNMCTCINCVLYCLYCVFCIVPFMYIYSYLFCLY
jgi:hypothetical protein